jgi:5-methylcytosine-specific restriction endonuclease McrA
VPWDSHVRKSTLPPDWQLRRIRVLRRDGYRCQDRDSTGRACLLPANHVDHIRPSSLGGSDDLDNLQALCAHHHAVKTSAEGHAARRAKRDPARVAEQQRLREQARTQFR